jgi:hypothetical protein|tara:strand:- start:1458 stop:1805 length:348 start_codon:yes stop_codon:yes gene_type:complete
MTYELGDDEVAFIIRPTSKGSLEGWDGTVTTGIAVGSNFCYSDDVLHDLVYIATLCSAFLDLMESDEEVMEMVVDHRRNLMMEELSRRQEEDKPLQELKGEVINFNAYTKTKGNA